MNSAATVTNDDGDKVRAPKLRLAPAVVTRRAPAQPALAHTAQVDHGWSMLDIAKHSTGTFVASLGESG